MWSGRAPSIVKGTARHGDGGDVRGRLDPVGNRVVFGRPQRARLDALDDECRGPDPRDVRSHGNEELAEVGDLGFARHVVEARDPIGQHGSREQVLGGPDRREVEDDVGAVKPIGERLEVAVAELERGTHRFEARHVHVDGAGTEVIAARQ